MNDDRLMTIDDVAVFLNVKRSWLYAHIQEFPHFKIGTLLRFDRNQIVDYLGRVQKGGGATAALKSRCTPSRCTSDVVPFQSRIAG